MKREKLLNIAFGLGGLDESEWNTVKRLVEMLFQKKAVEAHITLNSSEIADMLKDWPDD